MDSVGHGGEAHAPLNHRDQADCLRCGKQLPETPGHCPPATVAPHRAPSSCSGKRTQWWQQAPPLQHYGLLRGSPYWDLAPRIAGECAWFYRWESDPPPLPPLQGGWVLADQGHTGSALGVAPSSGFAPLRTPPRAHLTRERCRVQIDLTLVLS